MSQFESHSSHLCSQNLSEGKSLRNRKGEHLIVEKINPITQMLLLCNTEENSKKEYSFSYFDFLVGKKTIMSSKEYKRNFHLSKNTDENPTNVIQTQKEKTVSFNSTTSFGSSCPKSPYSYDYCN